MNLNTYQDEASKTIQPSKTDEKLTNVIPFLGIIGEVGSVVSQLKIKFRDGDSYVAYKKKLGEELGDVLWYIATIATQHGLTLEDIAVKNLEKVHDRFLDTDNSSFKDFDSVFPINERFPDEFEIEFVPFEEDGINKTRIIDRRTGEPIGDTLTDNTYEEDGYRFHDIFHYGFLAVLGWSPVLRKLLRVKRKSNSRVDENEDGARSQITEELISLFIYQHALEHDLLKDSTIVDSGIIKRVQSLARNTEVKACRGKQWEKAILNSYNVFNKLIANNGGKVLVSKKDRSLTYIGKD